MQLFMQGASGIVSGGSAASVQQPSKQKFQTKGRNRFIRSQRKNKGETLSFRHAHSLF
jgi:hypothetical protein